METKKQSIDGKTKLRTKRVVFTLADEEFELIQLYLKKNKITNRSRWYRETILTHVLQSMNKNYPTLFEENEMRR